MLQIATRVSLAAALSVATWAGAARADEVDACISAAEQAQVQRRDAHLRAARDALLVCARDVCPRAIQRDCKRWLGEVEAALPSVVFRVLDASDHDVVAVRVLVDGVPLAATLDGRALAVDPGEHLLRFEAGKRVVEQRVVIRAAERDRLLTVRLPEAPPPATSRSVPIGAWVLGGLGAVGVGTGVFLWALGRSERADLYATCGVKHDCAPSAVDRARAKLIGGDVAAGVGLAAVGAAVVWALAAPAAPRVPVDVQPVTGGGVVSWRGAF